jgi:hypothetical protein
MRLKMKKKMIKLIVAFGLMVTAFVKPTLAQEEFVINVADVTPAAPPAPEAAPSTPPAPEAAPPTPTAQADSRSEEKKVDFNAPLVSESQYFQLGCLNSKNITLNALKKMDCALFKRIYNEDPQRAVEQLMLVLLVKRALIGADVGNMPAQDRVDLAYATILGELRKYGRENEVRDYMGLGCGECKDRLIIPSAAALCQILEGVKASIILELYHVKLLFPVG